MDNRNTSAKRTALALAACALLGASGLALASAFSAAWEETCGTEIEADSPSPDGQARALFLKASCGAPDSIEVFGVSVLASGEEVTTSNEFNVLRSVSQSPEGLRVDWLAADTLRVSFVGAASAGPAKRVGDVTVVYAEVAP